MKKGLNFRTEESQKEYFEVYDRSLKLIANYFVDFLLVDGMLPTMQVIIRRR